MNRCLDFLLRQRFHCTIAVSVLLRLSTSYVAASIIRKIMWRKVFYNTPLGVQAMKFRLQPTEKRDPLVKPGAVGGMQEEIDR